ncbi:MAG: SHOCT domain-containing protein [Nitrospirae bacterium]|nr:MAG: SHOCT domain-containing protein [Nitrospirota bacterium]
MLCQACLGPERSARPIQEEQERFVRLEGRTEGAGRFAHPVALSPADWMRILAGIRIQPRKDSILFTRALEPPTEAFAPDEIAYLGRALSETFARAKPDEWVVFGMSRVLPSGLNEVTTGGWFAEETRLHLLLANYRHGTTKTAVRERLWNEPLRAVAAPFYEVVQDERQTVVKGTGLLSMLSSGAGPEIVIEYRALLGAPPPAARPAAVEKAMPGEKVAPAPDAGRLPGGAVEERLRMLKRLREQNLITDEEYREKKKEILGSF